MNYKKLTSIILLFFLLMSNIIYADDSILTVQDALELAANNSPDIMKYENAVKRLERDYTETVISSRSMKDMLEMDERFRRLSKKTSRTPEEEFEYKMLKSILGNYMSTSQRLEMTISSELSTNNMEYMIMVNKALLQSTRDNITISVHELYNSIAKIEEAIRIKRSLIYNLENSLRSANLKYIQGKLAYNDLLLLKLENQKGKIELDKLNIQREKGILQLHKVLGLPLDNRYKEYKYDASPEVIDIKDLQEYMDLALVNRDDIKNVQKQYEIEEKEFEIIKKFYYYDTNINHKNALIELNEAKSALENTKINVQIQVLNSYNQLVSQQNNLEKAKVNYEISKSNYNDIDSRYTLGLATDLNLADVNIEYAQKEVEYINQKRDTYLAKLNLDLICGVAVSGTSGGVK